MPSKPKEKPVQCPVCERRPKRGSVIGLAVLYCWREDDHQLEVFAETLAAAIRRWNAAFGGRK